MAKNTSNFTKAELEDYIRHLEGDVARLEEKLDDSESDYHKLMEEKDGELEELYRGFRVAFEDGFALAWGLFTKQFNCRAAQESERAWLTSDTRRKHGEG